MTAATTGFTAGVVTRPATVGGRRLTRRAANPRARAVSVASSTSNSPSREGAGAGGESARAQHEAELVSRRVALGSAAALVALPGVIAPSTAADAVKSSFYDYTVEQYGKPFDLGAFKGDVTVILNVASE